MKITTAATALLLLPVIAITVLFDILPPGIPPEGPSKGVDKNVNKDVEGRSPNSLSKTPGVPRRPSVKASQATPRS